MAKLVCGCGYLGLRVARLWLNAGETVWATTRSAQRAAEFVAMGLRPIVTDLTREFILPNEAMDVTTTLFAIGFDRTPGQSIESVYAKALELAIPALPKTLGKFIYISSTGVYEQSDGDWVNEQTPCRPTRAGGKACLAAELYLAESRLTANRRIVLRLAGLYGPQRLPKMASIQMGQPIESAEFGHLNLIHVDDAAQVMVDADQQIDPPSMLLVSDGNPVPRREFYQELARRLKAPSPRFTEPIPGSPANERASSDKRIDNRRLRDSLRRRLTFPSYREGLAAIVSAEP